MQESSYTRNFFQRNKKLLILIGTILLALYIGANIYVHITFPEVYKKIIETNKTYSTPSPTPEQSFEGVPCGGATVLGQCPSGYKCVPEPNAVRGTDSGICAKE